MHRWVQQESNSIANSLLIPAGFTPVWSSTTPVDSQWTFLPLKDHGHAACGFNDAPDGAPPRFELESYLRAAGDDEGAVLPAHLASRYGALMADRQCRCQLCLPTFEPVEIDIDLEFDMEI
ncbi:MAG TPA: hypothetical protein P5081_06090 [Phycisphaerae bacterium]|nr:hypothetical protein [Phycisphaerae bacterium]HRW52438.1 hypothetical protein [Phycisphaerae bacterium]